MRGDRLHRRGAGRDASGQLIPMERITSALFIDFDNVFGGLLQLDRKAAYALADEPKRWLDALAAWKLEPDQRRQILVQRAYLNPAGWVADRERGNEYGRLYLSTLRPNLTRAGFEVVDCPVLTSRQKNAADIRIVIDILQALEANTRYDEFILASSDADYAPLLRLLRANDRRTVVLATGPTSPAYHNLADQLIEPEVLVGLLTDQDDRVAVEPPIHDSEQDRAEVERLIQDYVARHEGPALLSALGIELRSSSLGEAIEQTGWFEAGSLGALIRSMDTSDLRVKGHYVWNITRHAEPEEEDDDTLPGMPTFIAQYCRITDLPRLNPPTWTATFAALARYAGAHDFNLTHCTAWTRDFLKERGVQVGRQAIGFVVRGTLYGGINLAKKPAPSADQIREALLSSTLDRAQAQGAYISEMNRTELMEWLGGNGSDVETGAQPTDIAYEETGERGSAVPGAAGARP